ncbi:uncharacterized protein LOC128235045 isoform X2 [Mya arenaria]|uniref:uncharacterized protein LOC128235045 isoform X2 n=1 Tax=Mya arenaria TaxID=6604 RepID=UPI0022E3108F|nr:uncharacterized protein LOC128235045 isoform X2 [Mya arenaria]
MTRFIAILIWSLYVVCSIDCESSCFRLLGGALDSEGLLQINVNNTWKNVCLKNDIKLTDSVHGVCLSIDRSLGATQINEPLIYGNKVDEGGIQMNNLTCQATIDKTDACPKFIICCQEYGKMIGEHLSVCSSNWLETNYCYPGQVVGIRVFLKHNDIQNVRRAWTSSAFRDSCKDNASYSVTTANILNKCLRTIPANSDKVYALIERDYCKWTTEVKCENARTFQLLEEKTASMDDLHCVTVEVQNGTRNFSIAHCSSYLPSICLKQERERRIYRPNLKTTMSSTKNTQSLTTTASNAETFVWPLYVIAAIVALALTLIACYQYRKYKKTLLERRRMDAMPLPEM